MKKNGVLGLVGSLLFLVAFNAIFFILGDTEKFTTAVWIAYGMINGSYLILVASPWLVGRDKFRMENSVTLIMLSSVHFALEFLISLIVILVKPEGYKGLLVLYIILLAVYFILLFTLASFNSHTSASEARQRAEVFYIRNQASRVQMLIGKLSDSTANRKIEQAYDNLHASPTRSSAQAASVEREIAMKVGDLEHAVRENEIENATKLATELSYLVEERTRILQIGY